MDLCLLRTCMQLAQRSGTKHRGNTCKAPRGTRACARQGLTAYSSTLPSPCLPILRVPRRRVLDSRAAFLNCFAPPARALCLFASQPRRPHAPYGRCHTPAASCLISTLVDVDPLNKPFFDINTSFLLVSLIPASWTSSQTSRASRPSRDKDPSSSRPQTLAPPSPLCLPFSFTISLSRPQSQTRLILQGIYLSGHAAACRPVTLALVRQPCSSMHLGLLGYHASGIASSNRA